MATDATTTTAADDAPEPAAENPTPTATAAPSSPAGTSSAPAPPPAPAVPADVEQEALGLIAGHLGGSAVAQLQQQIDNLNARAATAATGLKTRRPAADVHAFREFVKWIAPSITRRREYEDRVESLQALISPGALRSVSEGRATPAEEIKALAESALGVPTVAGFVAEMQSKHLTDSRSELAKIAEDFKHVGHHLRMGSTSARRDPIVGAFEQDHRLNDLRTLIQRRRLLEARVARLDGDASSAVQARSHATTAAVTAAGGPDAVARGVVESRKVRGQWWRSDPQGLELERLDAAVAQADAHLASLGVTPETAAPDSYAATVAKDRATNLAAADALRKAINGRLTAAVADLVAAAIAGDESSRATLAADAAALPRAFAVGFPDAIAAARFEGSQFEALVEAITTEQRNAAPVLQPAAR